MHKHDATVGNKAAFPVEFSQKNHLICLAAGSLVQIGLRFSTLYPQWTQPSLNQRVHDQADERTVHLFDTSTGKPLNDGKAFTHQ